MTDVIFSFDTENFTNPIGADGILNEARILRSEGIKGNFLYVGLLCGQLENWGRQDIIEEMSHHKVGIHSYAHTMHPVIDEYTDIEDPFEAERRVIESESKAVEEVKRLFNVSGVVATMPPGNQHSYAAMYAYAKMGIPIYADTFIDYPARQGLFYCNMYHFGSQQLEEWLFHADEKELREKIDSFSEHNIAMIATHPDKSICAEWWDELNYMKSNCEWGKWKMSRLRPKEETERFYSNYRRMVQLIKADPRFRIRTYDDIADDLAAMPVRYLTRKDMSRIAAELKQKFSPVKWEQSYCLSDIFLACRDFLLGKENHECGFVYGFLNRPDGITESVTVTAADMIDSAEKMNTDNYLPEVIRVGNKMLGAGDWLRAALQIVGGSEVAVVEPDVQLPSLDAHPLIKNMNLKGTWCHSDSFEDRYLSDRLRWQSWTLRY